MQRNSSSQKKPMKKKQKEGKLSASGIDGIQNFWCKSLKQASGEMKREFEEFKNNNDLNQSGGLQEKLCYF